MIGPIEIEHYFQQEYKRLEKKFNRQIARCYKRNPMMSKDFIGELIKLKALRRKELITGISDKKHSAQDYFRRNNFLADLFAKATDAAKKYDKLPLGNFFFNDYTQIKKEHQQKATTHPMWYAYRKNAFEYPLKEVVSLYAQVEVLDDLAKSFGEDQKISPQNTSKNPETPPLKTPTESLNDVISRTYGLMTREEVAEYFKKSPATISKWAKDGVIPSKLLHGKYVYNKADIDEWLKNR